MLLFLCCISSGVGRTGIFITLDAQLKRIKKEQTVDIFGSVRSMRKSRCYMVQTEVSSTTTDGHLTNALYKIILTFKLTALTRLYLHTMQPQYIFLHDALLEAIECGVTEVAARDLQNQFQILVTVDPVSGKTGLEKWFQVRTEHESQ